jgi:outer membrane protein OmpA-like peptidoglycan-associated protein
MKNAKIIIVLITLICAFFAACDWGNPIMEKWWIEPTPNRPEEPIYVPIIKTLPPEKIYETIKEDEVIYETIYEKLPPEVIVQQLPPEVIIQYVTDAEILEKIRNIPPENILDYLTDTQIEYIKSQIPPEVYIQQLPPQIFLQSISIVDIEYIIFSGDATAYNANSPTSGGTNLTTQEKTTNDDIVNVMAQMLRNPNYMLILHGHANPVTGTAAEAVQLTQISEDRANAVKTKLKTVYTGGEPLDNRITAKGYGGERNISMTGSSATSSLNRRVEAILFTIDTTQVSGGT